MDRRTLTLLACALALSCVERVGVSDPDGETSGDSDGVDESGSTDASSSDSGTQSDSGTDSDSETQSDSETESDSGRTTTGFAGATDFGPGFVECDPFLKDCPDGDKCVPYGYGGDWDGHRCIPVAGDQAAGEPCEYHSQGLPLDDCDATTMCWNLVSGDSGWVGTCVPFCTGTPDAPICPPGMTCMISRDIPVWCE